MEKTIITFSANEQKLQKTGGVDCYASNTVAYIEARFDLGENWNGYDSVRAVWWNDYSKTVASEASFRNVRAPSESVAIVDSVVHNFEEFVDSYVVRESVTPVVFDFYSELSVEWVVCE